MFHARPNLVRPSEVSAKVQNRSADHASHDPGNMPAVGQATPRPRTTKRASRETPRGRATLRVPRPMPSEPGNYVPRPTEISSAKFTRRPRIRPARPFRLGHDPMSGRSSRPTVPTPRQSLCSIPILPRSVHLQRSRSLVKPDSASKPAVGHATTGHATTAHDQSARAGSNASRPRNSPHVPRTNASSDRETMPRVRPKISIGQFLSARPRRPIVITSGPTVPTRPKTRLSGRSSRTTVRTPRSTRSRF
ncbi:unnamed protein product [Microthlaspi erraticum]|uniref:Uncharacterized protein n=1 Tax=Microthlaspi erraticum TaxID=1685480 RepID=A0A6D2HSC8_9BRAS|nr:unnamed protein product [Microthlaspi erraticum]